MGRKGAGSWSAPARVAEDTGQQGYCRYHSRLYLQAPHNGSSFEDYKVCTEARQDPKSGPTLPKT
jgi:hypothetical protein